MKLKPSPWDWINKLSVNVIDEEDGTATIVIDWDETDEELTEWTGWGEEKQKEFIYSVLQSAVNSFREIEDGV
jgi:hypothetical protein